MEMQNDTGAGDGEDLHDDDDAATRDATITEKTTYDERRHQLQQVVFAVRPGRPFWRRTTTRFPFFTGARKRGDKKKNVIAVAR